FEDWYYDNVTFRDVFTAGSLVASPITSDITVYAKWNEILSATDGLEYALKEDDTYEVTGYGGTSVNVVVAETYNNIPVTSIKENAFLDNTAIKSVVISNAATEIGAAALKGCTALESLTLPFVGSSRQKNMASDGVLGHIFGNTDTYIVLEKTTEQFFDMAESLYYYIPQSLNEIKITDAEFIPYGAFYGCKYVKEIEFNDSVTHIYAKAFADCNALNGVYIPSGVATIEKAAFSNSLSLKLYCASGAKPTDWNAEWKIGNTPVHWGVPKNALGKNDDYQYLIENNAVSITGYISDEIENVMPSAIENKPVAKIKAYAFSGTNIYKITVPDSVIYIARFAFFEATLLNTLDLPFLGETATAADKAFIGHLFGSLDSSINKDTVPTKLRKVLLRGGGLSAAAFENCDKLSHISLPSQLTYIGDAAFRGCADLKDVDAPDSVTDIAANAFAGCSSLQSFDMPRNLSAIGENAFNGCASLDEISLPTGVKILSEGVFKNCIALINVTLPQGITKIEKSAFEGCSSLTVLTLPDDLTIIGVAAFRGCSGLTGISVPDKVFLIDANAFENCSAMTEIFLPDSIITIGAHTFRGCSILNIYSEYASKPAGWLDQWNIDDRPVQWNYTMPQN
ncbi:MAG: leucine-rich repeat domain-containing protein, partial [Clostridia bacterium]|nr:leucine-rich repeat domain-containing protein [Clostridia bacterium]